MPTFHDDQIYEEVEKGVDGGPAFKTAIFEADGGDEKRNKEWAQTRGIWDLSYGIMHLQENDLPVDIDRLTAFFYARQGNAHSWRFKAWDDFRIGDPINPTVLNQRIGLGDDATTQFQVFKRYQSGAEFFDRTTRLLVSGTYTVLLDNVPQVGGGTDYTATELGGLIDFVTAPASTGGTGPGGEESVEITTEYHNVVRFDLPLDHWRVTVASIEGGSLQSIPIKETRDILT